MNAEHWLCFGGVEVGSALRTLTYLRRGLGGSTWEVHLRSPMLLEGSGMSDIIVDVFELEPFAPANLRCYCAALDDGPYIDPATDDAPWYVAERPESANFLGFIPWSVEVRPSLSRAAQQGQRGAVLGPQAAGGQLCVVQGQLVATTPAAMRYGEGWLRAVLSGQLCDSYPDLRFLPACPEEGDAAMFRSMTRVGLIDGPVMGPVADGVKACLVQTVDFQMLAEGPMLLGDPLVVLGPETMAPSSTYRALATRNGQNGDAGLRFTIDVPSGDGSPLVDVHVAAYRTTGGACPSPVPSPSWEFDVEEVPAGHKLTVDGVEELVEVRDPATDEVVAALDVLDYKAPFAYPRLVQCSEVCLEVTTGVGTPNGTTLTLEQVDREL